MKKLVSLIFLCLFFGFSYSQSEFKEGRYRVTFKDKANSPYSIERPDEFLSQKSIDRRKKFNIAITEQDIPVNPQYLSVLSDFGAILCNRSKWFNSAIFYIESEFIFNEIAKLKFVKTMEFVAPKVKYQNDERQLEPQDTIKGTPLEEIKKIIDANPADRAQLTVNLYGNSCRQNVLLETLLPHLSEHIGQGMTIAVVDAGFLHVDSAAVFQKIWDENRILLTRDMTGTEKFYDTASIFQSGSHGMMVLSLIGGFYPGKLVGTAPGANFILLRSEEEETEYIVEEDNWVAAAELADSAGADIISTSLGYSTFDDSTQNHTYAQTDGNTARITVGADIAASKGILLVNSAGNAGDEPWKYITSPADADSIITVGACKYNGKKTKFSSFGPTSNGKIKPDVMALGLYPTIVTPNGTIKNTSGGTSFSCPLTAGCCATLWEEFPDSSAQAIKKVIMRSGDRYDKPNNKYGYGVVNVAKARAYCYTKTLYDVLNQKYILPDYDEFFETLWDDGKGYSSLTTNFVFAIQTGKTEESFIVKNFDYSNIVLPELTSKKSKFKFYKTLNKSTKVAIKVK